MSRSCPYCGSPARGNPCWWYIKHVDNGGDPACMLYEDQIDEPAPLLRTFVTLILLSVAVLFVIWVLR